MLENIVRPDTIGSVEEMDAKFDLLQRSQCTYVQDSRPVAVDSRTPFGLLEARNSLKIAKAAGAEKYATDSFQKATQLLEQAETTLSHKGDKKQIEMSAREAVQTAEDARAITVKRRDEERLAQERAAAAQRESDAKAQTEAAERATLQAQLVAELAAREKAEAESARAAAFAQQQAAQAAAENSRLAAEQASRERAAAEAARASSEAARASALAQQQAAQADAENARKAAEQAEAEKADLRAKLLAQLNTILQTRDSARGLIVNMSDVLFDTGSFTLKPGAREKLAKISGILLAHAGLTLQIEGHTDNVGSNEYNQQLSDRRATSVQDFLVQQGVSAGSISAIGFGKMEPVASNDTAEGRQLNRRVELVVNGEDIGATAGGSQSSQR